VDPLQTHYSSENLEAPEIEPGPMDLHPGTLTTRLQRRFVRDRKKNKKTFVEMVGHRNLPDPH
jgi:hypothetical protein